MSVFEIGLVFKKLGFEMSLCLTHHENDESHKAINAHCKPPKKAKILKGERYSGTDME